MAFEIRLIVKRFATQQACVIPQRRISPNEDISSGKWSTLDIIWEMYGW